MNTTLLVMCLAIFLYVAACVFQWRRLNRGDDGKNKGRASQPHEQ